MVTAVDRGSFATGSSPDYPMLSHDPQPSVVKEPSEAVMVRVTPSRALVTSPLGAFPAGLEYAAISSRATDLLLRRRHRHASHDDPVDKQA
jgi:hypothetical protein